MLIGGFGFGWVIGSMGLRKRIILGGVCVALLAAAGVVAREATVVTALNSILPPSIIATPTMARWFSIASLGLTTGIAAYLCMLAGRVHRDMRRLKVGIRQLRSHGGELHVDSLNFREVRECAEELTGLASWLRTEQGRLADDATRDPLTGLANRRFLEDTLVREVAASMRTHWPLSFIMVDLDHFKKLNDTYGHQVGDVVLKRAAERMASLVRESDLVARFGGEEFAIVLPRATLEKATEMANELRNALRCDPIVAGEQTIPVSASFGVAEVHACGLPDGDSLVRQADIALYEAKEAGRDTVVAATTLSDGLDRDDPDATADTDTAGASRQSPPSDGRPTIDPDTMGLMGSTFSILQVIPDQHRVAHDMIQQVAATLHCGRITLFMWDATQDRLVRTASLGVPSYESAGNPAIPDDVSAWFSERRLSGGYSPDRHVEVVQLDGAPEGAMVRLPLALNGALHGVIEADGVPECGNLSQRQAALLSAICLIGVTALDICSGFVGIESQWAHLFEALSTGMGAHDDFKQEHADRVGTLSVRIAKTLGQTDEDQLRLLRIACLLHDIGESAIPRRIREKKSKLRFSERSQLQRHTRIGASLIESAGSLEHLANIVLHHHEHYDGGGYPDQLAGEQIPIESRIIAVADAYVAMTSDRPYRAAMSDAEAISEILCAAGAQFDRVVVDAFCDCHGEGVETTMDLQKTC